MEFEPIMDRKSIKTMDSRIFSPEKMGLCDDMFSVEKGLRRRLEYKPENNTVYLDLTGFFVNDEDQLFLTFSLLKGRFDDISQGGKNKFHMVVNYDGFDIREDLADLWSQYTRESAEKYYASVSRYAGRAFRRHKLSTELGFQTA